MVAVVKLALSTIAPGGVIGTNLSCCAAFILAPFYIAKNIVMYRTNCRDASHHRGLVVTID
jgi:hypothetical protein